MLLPLVHKALEDLLLALRIDEIEVYGVLLHKAVDAVHGLELVIELVVNEHDRLVAVVLEV